MDRLQRTHVKTVRFDKDKNKYWVILAEKIDAKGNEIECDKVSWEKWITLSEQERHNWI